MTTPENQDGTETQSPPADTAIIVNEILSLAIAGAFGTDFQSLTNLQNGRRVSSNVQNNNEIIDEEIVTQEGEPAEEPRRLSTSPSSASSSEGNSINPENPRESVVGENVTAITSIQQSIEPTPVASSNHVTTNQKIIQSTGKFLDSFFTQTINDHQVYKTELRQSLQELSTSTSRSLKTSLKLLKLNLRGCKKRARTLMELRSTKKNKSVRYIHLNAYVESLKRIEKVAEKTFKTFGQFLKLGRKLTSLVLLKETPAFTIFSDFLIDIKSLIITLAYSNMFTELANQQNALNELRVSVEVGLARASKALTHKALKDPRSDSDLKQKQWRQVQGIFEHQVKNCPGSSRQFLADFNRITHDFYETITAKADHRGRHNLAHEEKFNQILGDVKLQFPLAILENIRHHKTQMLRKPSNTRVYNVPQQPYWDGRSASADAGYDLGISDEVNSLTPQNPTRISLLKHIQSWEKYLIVYIKLHSSHRKAAANRMKKISTDYLENSIQILASSRIQACINVRKTQKSLLKNLKTQIKIFSANAAEKNLLPSALDLLDLDDIEGLEGNDDNGNICHHKPRSIDRYMMKIQEESGKATQIFEKWSLEFAELAKKSSEQFLLLVNHNQRHIDPWLFRDNLIQITDIIVPTFQQDVKLLFESLFEMVQNLNNRLKLDQPMDPSVSQSEGESDQEDQQRGFMGIANNHRLKFEGIASVFAVHFNLAVQQYAQHMEHCCQIIHNFSLTARDIMRKSMFNVHKSLVYFAKAQDQPGMTRIVVSSSSNNTNNVKNDQVAPAGPPDDDENDKILKNYAEVPIAGTSGNQRVLFDPDALPHSSLWKRSNLEQPAEKPKVSQKKKATEDNQRELVVGRSESQKQFQKDFIQSYVIAAEQEKEVPGWANRNINQTST